MNLINLLVANISREVKICKCQLEVEESGRKVATLQGNITGYKKLVGHLAAEFGLTQMQIEDIGDEPPLVPDLRDHDVHDLNCQRVVCEGGSQEFDQVLARIKQDFESLKSDLLYTANSTRDLDLAHGQREAEDYWKKFFKLVREVAEERERKLQERLKNPELFDEEQAG